MKDSTKLNKIKVLIKRYSNYDCPKCGGETEEVENPDEYRRSFEKTVLKCKKCGFVHNPNFHNDYWKELEDIVGYHPR